jgi:hypothetical protein
MHIFSYTNAEGKPHLYKEPQLVRFDVSNTSLSGDLPILRNSMFLREVNCERTQLRSSTLVDLPTWVEELDGTGVSNSTHGKIHRQTDRKKHRQTAIM